MRCGVVQGELEVTEDLHRHQPVQPHPAGQEHADDAQRQLDREMADRVQAALNADTLLYSRHIRVLADGGVVNLSGYVWSRDDLDEAKRVASAVPGVTNVVNDMELERNGIDDSPVSR